MRLPASDIVYFKIGFSIFKRKHICRDHVLDAHEVARGMAVLIYRERHARKRLLNENAECAGIDIFWRLPRTLHDGIAEYCGRDAIGFPKSNRRYFKRALR